MGVEESCHESSALGLITRLGVPDVIGDATVSVEELSEKTGADKQSLGAYIRAEVISKQDSSVA